MASLSFKCRLRGFLPVVVDVETAGFNAATDALLEVAAVFLTFNEHNQLVITDSYHAHIKPFQGANIEQSALDFLGVDIEHPFRFAVEEKKALKELCQRINAEIQRHECTRAVLVGHNPMFDLGFLQSAFARHHMGHGPFHKFTTFDTATLAALAYGQTVLAKALQSADIAFDEDQAHGALYDATKTAELFCQIFNFHDYSLDR